MNGHVNVPYRFLASFFLELLVGIATERRSIIDTGRLLQVYCVCMPTFVWYEESNLTRSPHGKTLVRTSARHQPD